MANDLMEIEKLITSVVRTFQDGIDGIYKRPSTGNETL
jgi:hypothetical protein